MAEPPLLEVRDLTIQYETRQGNITAVSNASFTIEEGDYAGLVGESGCGKSTLSRAILGGLDDNGIITNGEILYRGTPIHDMSDRELNREIRWKEISWIPQGSLDSLDPLERISDQALELADVHTDLRESEALARFEEMFEVVGLHPDRVHDYPHQFSGGMQQRAIIALALFLEPSLIIADEPTTALDVIMQDQIFKYLEEIRKNDISMLIITHDIALIFEICSKIAVMHSGQIAEVGDVTEVYDNPRHPYTILLQGAFPDIRFPNRELEEIDGYPPQLVGEVDYCTFVDRCPWAIEECRMHEPTLQPTEADSDYHRVACFRQDEALELYRREMGDDAESRTSPVSMETAGSTGEE